MNEPFLTLARAKLMATGVILEGPAPSREALCRSEAEFNDVVSAHYKFFREQIALDVSVLRNVSKGPRVSAFDRLLKDLRMVAQHTGNPDAVRRVDRFKMDHPTWEERGRVLGEHFEAALQELAKVAVRVSRDAGESANWKAAVSLDLGSVLDAVLSDLSIEFPAWKRTHLQRQVAARVRHNPPTRDHLRVVQDFCVQEVASERHVLPVPYYDVLNFLGLLGSSQAEPAILVAYSVAATAPALGGVDFLKRVKETWDVARSV